MRQQQQPEKEQKSQDRMAKDGVVGGRCRGVCSSLKRLPVNHYLSSENFYMYTLYIRSCPSVPRTSTFQYSSIICSVRKRPVRSGLGFRAARLGFCCGRPGRTVGYSQAFRAYLTGPGRTADICRHSSDKM